MAEVSIQPMVSFWLMLQLNLKLLVRSRCAFMGGSQLRCRSESEIGVGGMFLCLLAEAVEVRDLGRRRKHSATGFYCKNAVDKEE